MLLVNELAVMGYKILRQMSSITNIILSINVNIMHNDCNQKFVFASKVYLIAHNMPGYYKAACN